MGAYCFRACFSQASRFDLLLSFLQLFRALVSFGARVSGLGLDSFGAVKTIGPAVRLPPPVNEELPLAPKDGGPDDAPWQASPEQDGSVGLGKPPAVRAS